jgi:hypothetical protein
MKTLQHLFCVFRPASCQLQCIGLGERVGRARVFLVVGLERTKSPAALAELHLRCEVCGVQAHELKDPPEVRRVSRVLKEAEWFFALFDGLCSRASIFCFSSVCCI